MEKRKDNLNFYTLYVTCPTMAEAKKIARLLVQRKLIACANLIDSIESIYEWKGECCEEKEVLLLAKTIVKNQKEIELLIEREHSYDVPCVIFLPIFSGLPSFLTWVVGASTS